MPRISGTESSAATKCISDVPGFVKHTSTPESTSVRMRACAPFGVSVMARAWSSVVISAKNPAVGEATRSRRYSKTGSRFSRNAIPPSIWSGLP